MTFLYIAVVCYSCRFPNLAVCNISRDSIRSALSIGITADQVQLSSCTEMCVNFVVHLQMPDPLVRKWSAYLSFWSSPELDVSLS